MAIKTSKQDVIWSFAGTVLSMCVNLLLLPFLIRFLDANYLGLWYVFASVGSLAQLLDFGFNPTIARNIAYVWSGARELTSEGVGSVSEDGSVDYDLLARLQSTCRALYLAISLVALVVMALVGTAYIFSVAEGLDPLVVGLSWGLYATAVFLNLYYGYFATLLQGVGAVRQYNQILVLSRSAQLVLSLGLLIAGAGILAPAVAYLAYGFLLRLLSKRAYLGYEGIGQKVAGRAKASVDEIKALFKVMWHNAWRDGLVSLSQYFASQATVIVCSLYLSLADTGTYSISVQLATAVYTIASVLYTSSQPSLQSACADGRKEYLRERMALCMVAYLLITVVFTAGLVTVGVPVLSMVKPGTVFSRPVLLFLGVYYYLYRRETLYASFISNTNQVPYMMAFLVSSVLGIVLSVVLCGVFEMGVWGLLIGQAVPQLVYNCWKWPKVVYEYLDVTAGEMLRLGFAQLKRGK